MSKATKALEYLISGIVVDSRRLGPGQVILKADSEIRESLKNLTSNEIRNIRKDALYLRKCS